MQLKNRYLGSALLLALLFVISACAGGAPAAPTGTKASEAPKAPEFRVVKHVMGETRVPVNPKRVVVLDTGELDHALALGTKPVGSVTGRDGSAFPVYLGNKVDGITDVGTYSQPNLEVIAGLKPDLILSSKLRHESIYDKLSQIAPTVFTETVGEPWKANLKIHAEALGKTEEADRLMKQYDARVQEFRTKMGDRLGTTRVSIVRSLPDHVRIMMKATFIGTILKDAGLPRPAAQDKDVFMEKATEERIPDLDGDAIFVMHFKPDDSHATKLMQSPLWKQLNGVKQGKVYEVSDDTWSRGIGILGANAVLDDLFKHLLPK